MFAHIHTHTHYSTLDGMGQIEELILRAKELGQPAIAITDHGSTSGLYEAVKLGKKHNIKIVLGSEFYFETNEEKRGHLILLAKNNEGLKNIYRLQEHAYVYNFHTKPLIDFDVLARYSSNLICCSACLANPIPQLIMKGDIPSATKLARELKELFDEDFYLEIQPNAIPEQVIVNKTLVRIGQQLNIKLVATNDIHYVFKEDAYVHEVLLAMQVGKKMSDEKRFKFTGDDFYLKSKEEMKYGLQYLRNETVDEAINTTMEIVNKCDATIEKGNYLPKYPFVPEDSTEGEELKKLVMKNYKEEMFNLSDVEYELDVIERNGYSGYFLNVAEYVNWARNNGLIVGDGRGSGAGSKVGYIAGIHTINPDKYNLLFERFMADGREPDIDVDFSDIDAVFSHLQEVHGEENVARIIAFGKLTAKACTRKVFSTFDHPQKLIAQINACMPKRQHFTLQEAFDESVELRKFAEKYPNEFNIIARLEGVISHESQHAGGVIICQNLSEHLPIKTRADARDKRIVAYDKYMLEELGHFKFDILSLQTLTVIYNTVELLRKDGIQINLQEIDYEEPEVYEMLCKGDLSGIFQLADQVHKIKEQQPRNFDDLIAINALIRPGVGDWNEYIARRNGKHWEIHPDRMPYMKDTVGTITYQEQFELDCKTFAGWGIAFADKKVRKNKDIRNDADLEIQFMLDCNKNGYSPELVIQIWKEICDAVDGGYSFNKSHSASYAVLSYQTAWLKYHYPKYFYASLLTLDGDNQTIVGDLIVECKNKGITILPPNINESGEEFTATSDGIRYRITTIKGVGSSSINHIKSLRPITSLNDMLSRGQKRFLKKNVVDTLIKAGCFDFENSNRVELLQYFHEFAKTKEIVIDEWNEATKTRYEKESLGMYLSKHPLEKYSFKPFSAFTEGSQCMIAGEIINVAEIRDKNGNLMAFITLSSHHGNTKCIIFSSKWEGKNGLKQMVKDGIIVMVKGRVSGDFCLVDVMEVLE